jgi:hypothetical protein
MRHFTEITEELSLKSLDLYTALKAKGTFNACRFLIGCLYLNCFDRENSAVSSLMGGFAPMKTH